MKIKRAGIARPTRIANIWMALLLGLTGMELANEFSTTCEFEIVGSPLKLPFALFFPVIN
jgi:hypothetical protein